MIFEAERLVQIDCEDLRENPVGSQFFPSRLAIHESWVSQVGQTRPDRTTEETGVDQVIWSRRAIWETRFPGDWVEVKPGRVEFTIASRCGSQIGRAHV